MNRHSSFRNILVLMMIISSILGVSPPANLHARPPEVPRYQPESAIPFLDTGDGTFQGQSLVIDFDTVLTVPFELREPIEKAMLSARSLLPAGNHFTVTALRISGDWMHAVLVPTYIVEAGWEVELNPNEIIEVLGQRNTTNQEFYAYLRGSLSPSILAQEVPKPFIDFSTPSGPITALAVVDYLFPWTSGQSWYKTQGWHSGNALDFQPVARTNPSVHLAVLAAASGRLTEICNDGYQSSLRIEHADGNTTYLHLDVHSIRRDLLGQNIQRGQFIGLLYNGHQGERNYNGYHYQYWTSCGYGTAFHLHFVLPRTDMVMDGVNANAIAASAFATQYRSSNVRIDSSGGGDQDGGSIGYGETKNGTISPAGDSDDFYFNASAGDTVEIRQNKNGSSLDSYVQLFGPGNYFAFDDDSGGSLNSFLRRSLPLGGQYRIRAKAYGSSTGAYTLSLNKVSDTCDGEGDRRWIAFGQTLNGTICLGDQDTYYFSGTAGRVASIRMNKTGGGLDPYLELWSPSGILLKVNDDGGGSLNSWLVHTLPSNGTYRIVARAYNNASSGSYSIKLESVTGGNLARGKPVWVSSVEFAGVEGWRATDGNMGTRWSSQFRDPQQIYIDLGQNRTFNQVVLKWETAYGKRFGIYYWTGSRWQNVYWTNDGRGGTNTINFSPVTARYVTMYGVERGTPWGYSLWEFEVYDTTTTTVPDVPPDDPGKIDSGAVAPLPPTEDGKEVLASGDGECGQEEMPLSSPGDAMTVTQPVAGTQSVIAFINSPSDLDGWYTPVGYVRFEGIANSQVGTNTLAITGYSWRSDRNGEIGSQSLFTLSVTSLLPGAHTIYFQAQNELGTWSEEVTTTLTVDWPNKVYLPVVIK